MDSDTELLVEALRVTPTDLARLIERLADREGRVLWIPAAAIAAWQARAPAAWAAASAWLARRQIAVRVIDRSPAEREGARQ